MVSGQMMEGVGCALAVFALMNIVLGIFLYLTWPYIGYVMHAIVNLLW